MIQTRFLFLVFDGASICSFRTQNRSTQKKAPEMGTERRSRLAFLAFSRQKDSCQAATQKRQSFFWVGGWVAGSLISWSLPLGSPKNQEKEIRAILLSCPFSSLLSAAVFETTGKSFFCHWSFLCEKEPPAVLPTLSQGTDLRTSMCFVQNSFRNFHLAMFLQTFCASAKKLHCAEPFLTRRLSYRKF